MTYHLERVWPSPTEASRDEVVQFWLAESALPDRTVARERAHQLVLVARDSSHRIAGVSTGLPMYVDRLGFECLFYRMYVGRAHRTIGLHSTGLGWRILQESYRLLNERFRSGCDRNMRGIYMEIENPSVMKVRNDAIWQENGMNVVFIGRTPDGRHMRVWYFDGARIPR